MRKSQSKTGNARAAALRPALLGALLFFFLSFSAFAQANAGVSIETSTAWLWRQAVGGAVIGRPLVQAQSVVVALDGGSVKAYSASGRPLWAFSARGRISPHITRSREGTTYLCRTNGVFIALSRIGKELWRADVGGPLSGPAAVGWDGRVFVPAARKVLCFAASGSLLWARELDGAIGAGPWLDQGGGILLALESSGAMAPGAAAPGAVRIDPYGAASALQLPPGARMLLPAGPSIMALYPDGGVHLLDASLPDAAPASAPRLPSAPLAAASRGNFVAAALADGRLALLSANGEARWVADTHARVLQARGLSLQENDAAVVYDERGIYALSANGASAFTADGRRLWYTALKNASSVPAFDDEGVLYSGGTDWILYAWKLERRAARQKLTLYGPAPPGSYGKEIYRPAAFAGYYDEAEVKEKLQDMQREILAGRVGENEREWLVYLMNVAASGERQGMFSISLRLDALRLLARIGSGETMPWLTRFFRAEREAVVKAAAAYAIGGIGLDPNGVAIRELLDVAIEGSLHDERVLVAVAAAAGALCRYSGPPLFDQGARLLVLLSSPDQKQSVRQQANSELGRLRE